MQEKTTRKRIEVDDDIIITDFAPPTWVPLPPDPYTRGDRIRGIIRRLLYGFLFTGFLALLAYFFWYSPSTVPSTTLSPEELASIDSVRAAYRQTVDPVDGASAGLNIQSLPVGATVMIDFDSVGTTPLEMDSLTAGAYIVSIRKKGFASTDTVIVVNAGETQSFFADLLAGTAAQKANTDTRPLLVDTPAEKPKPAAKEPVRNATAHKQATVPPVTENVEIPAPPARGDLAVTANAAGTQVLVDGRQAGTAPLSLSGLVPGRHRVVLRKEGMSSFEADVMIEGGKVTRVNGELVALIGSVSVLVKPWGSIYIDGKLKKRDSDVQYSMELPVGTHQIRVSHPVLGAMDRSVTIREGATARVVFDLNAKSSTQN